MLKRLRKMDLMLPFRKFKQEVFIWPVPETYSTKGCWETEHNSFLQVLPVPGMRCEDKDTAYPKEIGSSQH